MKNAKRSILLTLVVAAVVFATGCPDRVSIADVERDPSKYDGKEIAVAGTVKDSYGVSIPGTRIRGGAYKIDDGTGSIWIFTEEGVPSKGALVGVKGIVGRAASWKGRNYGLGIYEKDRRFPKR
jgi:hypothetical protein